MPGEIGIWKVRRDVHSSSGEAHFSDLIPPLPSRRSVLGRIYGTQDGSGVISPQATSEVDSSGKPDLRSSSLLRKAGMLQRSSAGAKSKVSQTARVASKRRDGNAYPSPRPADRFSESIQGTMSARPKPRPPTICSCAFTMTPTWLTGQLPPPIETPAASLPLATTVEGSL